MLILLLLSTGRFGLQEAVHAANVLRFNLLYLNQN